MTLMRRICLLVAIMFWQGGFMFYSAVVVPVGTDILGSHVAQGFITRSVTNYLNLAGIFALALILCDIAFTHDTSRARRRIRWVLWLLLLVSLGSLSWLHVRLDHLINDESQSILDRRSFRDMHSWYLITSTAQWVASLTLLAFTLPAWKSEDRWRLIQRP